MPQIARVRVAREQVKRIGVLTREAEQLKRELRDLVAPPSARSEKALTSTPGRIARESARLCS